MSSMVPGIVRSEILKPLTCKIGRTAPDSAGSIHLCELMRYEAVSEIPLWSDAECVCCATHCQAPAVGPVSLSPSPTMTTVICSGRSMTDP